MKLGGFYFLVGGKINRGKLGLRASIALRKLTKNEHTAYFVFIKCVRVIKGTSKCTLEVSETAT
eukprot:782726-Pelagomonas_calceolata.AAC.4